MIQAAAAFALMAPAMLLAANARADDARDARFKARDVCDYLASMPGQAPAMEVNHSTVHALDGMIEQGVFDVDGDGTNETITSHYAAQDMTDGFGFTITTADGTEWDIAANLDDQGRSEGYPEGFVPFGRRWFLVTTQPNGPAWVTGALMLEKGSLKPVDACRFENSVAEVMAGDGASIHAGDDAWCAATAAADIKASRLKPALKLNDAQAASLTNALTSELGGIEYTPGDVFKPSVGPFAGMSLAKVGTYSRGANMECGGSTFRLVEIDGDIVRLVTGEKQELLNQLQSGERYSGSANCHADANLAEWKGRFFVEQTGGDDAPQVDEQLLHRIAEFQDEQASYVCESRFTVTPRVVYRNPELSR